MSDFKIQIKRENVCDSSYSNIRIKKEPKCETIHAVDVKPNISKIKIEPRSEFSCESNIKREVQPKQSTSKPVKKSKTVQLKAKKTTKRKRKPTKTKRTTKTRKKRKTKTSKKRRTVSAEQKGIKNARLQLARRIGIESKNGLPTAIFNKRRIKTQNEIDSAIGTLSLNGCGLNVPYTSTTSPEIVTDSFQENSLLPTTNQWFQQSSASSPPDIMNSIIQKQSLFLSKRRNYEIEKNGQVNYHSRDKLNTMIANEVRPCLENPIGEAFEKKPDIKAIKLEKLELEKSNIGLRVKQEFSTSSNAQKSDNPNNNINVKTERTDRLHVQVPEYCDFDLQIIEVKKEVADVPLISLDSPMADDNIKSEEQVKRERVKLEVKALLKPFFRNNEITENEYEEILNKSVPKVCKYSNNLNIVKLNQMVLEYIKTMKRRRKNSRSR